MTSALWQKDNYVINAKFIHSVRITEYDITKANISALLQSGIIDSNQYNELYKMDKLTREREVGLMQRADNRIYKAINGSVKEAKRQLFEANNLQNHEIIRIANDAVYVMRNAPLEYTEFGYMRFLQKDTYSIFCRIANVIYFYTNKMGEIELSIKGLGKEAENLHSDFFLTFIGNLLYLIESSNLESVISYYNGFYESYMKKELPIEYYRELNSDSYYRILSNSYKCFGTQFYNGDLKYIDISYNAYILRELYGCITELFRR